MPAPSSETNESYLAKLRELVVKEFGKTIDTKTDCSNLGELIESRTHKIVSINTIRRFFEVMPTTNRPSEETLNIFSLFCGFRSFRDFLSSQNHQPNHLDLTLSLENANELYKALGNTPLFYNTLNNLLQLAFRDVNLPFLKGFFSLNTFQGETDYTKIELKKVLMNLGFGLQKNPELFNELVGDFANNPSAQSLYFEHFVDYDFLTIRHHHAIRAYQQEKKQTEAQLFSLCLLFLHAFLVRDRNGCSDLIKKINAIEITSEIHPYPIGRKMACNILYQWYYLGSIKKSLIQEVFRVEETIPRSGYLGKSLPFYQSAVAEAFNWCGLHNEAVAIVEGSLPDYDTETDYFKISHLNVLWLNYSEGLLKSNRIEEARQVFTKVEAPHFAVDVKNFYTMQFCKLNSEIIKNENPRMATSMRKSAIEIASKHQFNFFETIYSRKD